MKNCTPVPICFVLNDSFCFKCALVPKALKIVAITMVPIWESRV